VQMGMKRIIKESFSRIDHIEEDMAFVDFD